MMDKRRALLEEKRRLLMEQVERMKSDLASKVGNRWRVMEAQADVAQVDVELARDGAAKVMALRQVVELRRELEQTAKARLREYGAERAEVMAAQIARIDAELALEAASPQRK